MILTGRLRRSVIVNSDYVAVGMMVTGMGTASTDLSLVVVAGAVNVRSRLLFICVLLHSRRLVLWGNGSFLS